MIDEGIEHRVEQELAHALQYLYDPTELRKNQLLTCLNLSGGQSPLTQLRRMLSGAIEALKPERHVPLDAHAWRIYHILTYRYVERLSQREVATDLALSVRQLRRDEHAAIRVLGHYLLHAHDIGSSTRRSEGEVGEGPSRSAGRTRELEWLRRTFPSETIDVATLVATVVTTARPLIDASQVHLTYDLPDCLPLVGGQLATVRQALLNVISALVPVVAGGHIEIVAEPTSAEIALRVFASCQDGRRLTPGRQMTESFAISRQLLEVGGGVLRLSPPSDAALLAITLPAALTQLIPVLVVDDNADTLQLFHRYLSGALFSLTCVADPEEALAVAVRLQPEAIILDVMLPGIDGWELLARLREHPETSAIPVIVCTILPQQQLAIALGAAAFLQKPFTRASLVRALDDLVACPEP